jgi:hypothetical protein
LRVLFSEGAAASFDELPERVQTQAARVIDLLPLFPSMFPRRQRGVMTGYRCFSVANYRFYHQHSSLEVRLAAIIPAMMKRA